MEQHTQADFQTSQWQYRYDTRFSEPLGSARNQQAEIQLHPNNVRPRIGNFHDLEEALTRQTGEVKKINIYTVRHGKAGHNEKADRYTKNIAWRFFARLRANFDPGLTPRGEDDAVQSGRILRDLIDREGAPRPVTVYTSPLRRCIQTAMYMIREMGLGGRQDGPGVVLCVREGLREWMGWGHGHQSDRHGTVSDIRALIEQLNQGLRMRVRADIDYRLEKDPEVREGEIEDFGYETLTDVDVRIRSILDEIFNKERAGSCVMVILHNRSNKSFLRVMGHSQNEVDKLDLENCAVLSYLVERTILMSDELIERQEIERKGSAQRHNELRSALEEKGRRFTEAVDDVNKLSTLDLEELKQALDIEKEKGDIWAMRAFDDLHRCLSARGPGGGPKAPWIST